MANLGLAERLREAVILNLEVTDRETMAELLRQAEGAARDEYALMALKLGVLALRTARGEIDTTAIKREGEAIMTGVKSAMVDQARAIQAALGQTLSEYFNPSDGKFTDRVERLIKKDGELERLIADRLTGEDSDLARRLAGALGPGSPLLAKLDPEAAGSVIASIAKTVATALDEQRERIVKQFSLDDSDSALSRLLGEITDKNGGLKKELTESIQDVVKEFSLDNEQSALSRMKNMVESTNKQICANLTLDQEDSALARLRREVVKTLEEQASAQNEFFVAVKTELANLTTRKEVADQSTLHGLDFEAALGTLLDSEASRLGDICQATGNTTGLIKMSKKGDFLIELGAESAAPGEKVVFEAKESGAYSLKAALEEIEEARKNRGASVGVFVFSKKTAPAGLEPITRHDNAIIAVWDREMETGELFVRLSYSLARALVVRRGRERAKLQFDFSEVDRAVNAISKEIERLEKIRGFAESIQNRGGDIQEEVRKSKDALRREIGRLEDQLESVKDLVRESGEG
jgi:hypothetical protein